MADVVYNKFKAHLLEGGYDFSNGGDTFKVMLHTSTFVPDQDNDAFIDDTSNEVSGTGYVAGGATLAGQAVTQENTDNEGVADGTDTSWASSTITARYATLYKSTGTASTSPVVCTWDFTEDKTSTNGTFTIQYNSEGIINIT